MASQNSQFRRTSPARRRFGGSFGKGRIFAAAAVIGVGVALAGTYWTSTAGGNRAAPVAYGRPNAVPAGQNLDAFAEGPLVSSAATSRAPENLDALAEGPMVSSAAAGPAPFVVLAAIAGGYQGGVHGDDLSVLSEGPIVSSAGR